MFCVVSPRLVIDPTILDTGGQGEKKNKSMKNRSMGGGPRVDGKRSRGLFGFFSFLSCVCS